MDLKIQIQGLPMIDFTPFVNMQDASGNKVSDYVEIVKGNFKDTFVEEFASQLNDTSELIRMAKHHLWCMAMDYCTPILKGWGGKEQAAYTSEFMKRLNIFQL
jgi:hypothetical protein